MLSEIFAVLGQTLSIYSFILIIRILLTWFPGIDWSNGVLSALTSITDPYLNIFRGIIPPIGGFDISSAMSFVSMLSELFSCDPRPKCSPNDSHTLKEGGSGKPSTDKPNTISVAQAAAAKAEEKAQSAIAIM